MSKVLFYYSITATSVLINITFAWITAKFIISKRSKWIKKKRLTALLVTGTGILLWSAIGRLGWSIQTWGGNSAREWFNIILFWCFSHVGTFLILTHIFISYLKK
jgi:hypothetical protein